MQRPELPMPSSAHPRRSSLADSMLESGLYGPRSTVNFDATASMGMPPRTAPRPPPLILEAPAPRFHRAPPRSEAIIPPIRSTPVDPYAPPTASYGRTPTWQRQHAPPFPTDNPRASASIGMMPSPREPSHPPPDFQPSRPPLAPVEPAFPPSQAHREPPHPPRDHQEPPRSRPDAVSLLHAQDAAGTVLENLPQTGSSAYESVVTKLPGTRMLQDALPPIALLSSQQTQQTPMPVTTATPSSGKPRRHVCMHPGCSKSFTTSGHLARHHRIHTGEKRFVCMQPDCESRFSRHDNMIQHYRTHSNTRQKRGGRIKTTGVGSSDGSMSPISAVPNPAAAQTLPFQAHHPPAASPPQVTPNHNGTGWVINRLDRQRFLPTNMSHSAPELSSMGTVPPPPPSAQRNYYRPPDIVPSAPSFPPPSFGTYGSQYMDSRQSAPSLYPPSARSPPLQRSYGSREHRSPTHFRGLASALPPRSQLPPLPPPLSVSTNGMPSPIVITSSLPATITTRSTLYTSAPASTMMGGGNLASLISSRAAREVEDVRRVGSNSLRDFASPVPPWKNLAGATDAQEGDEGAGKQGSSKKRARSAEVEESGDADAEGEVDAEGELDDLMDEDDALPQHEDAGAKTKDQDDDDIRSHEPDDMTDKRPLTPSNDA